MRRILIAALCVVFAWPVLAATKIEKVRSPGGIEAWLVHEPMLPIVAMEAAWRGGGALEPQGREGLARMTMALLDEGAGDDDDLAFKRRMEDKAIELGFSSGLDTLRGTLRTLSEHREEAFRLFGLALTRPRFDAQPVARIRAQLQAAVVRAEQDPNAIASRIFYRTVFPAHPYGVAREGTRDSLNAITVTDMRDFARRRLGRDNLMIGVVGAITAAELAPLLDMAFGALPEKAAPATLAEAVPQPGGGPVVIRRDQPQSVVMFGGPGLKREDPDWYTAQVLNYVIGGGSFSSRLMNEVREKRGLAYSVYTYLAPYDRAGLHMGGVGTRNDAVAESLRLIRAEFTRIRAEGVTPAELEAAKQYLTGSFPLQLTSNGRIAGFLVGMQISGLGTDYIERYPDYINKVTGDDIKRVAQRLLDPATMTVIVVGQPEGLGG